MKNDKIKISGMDLLLNGEGKLGRHNTNQKSHVHKTARDRERDRNSKSSRKSINDVKKKYM